MRRGGFRLTGERRAHGVDQRIDVGFDLLDSTEQWTETRRIGVCERALYTDLEHPRSEAIDVNSRDDHPRGICFAHSEQ